MSEYKAYNFRKDKDGEYFMYLLLGVLIFGFVGYHGYNLLSPYWASDYESEEIAIVGGVKSESGEYVNVFGDVIGQFFQFKLPNGTTINIPRGGFEEKFLNSLNDPSTFGSTYIFDRLYFQTGSSSIDQNSDDQINSVTEVLRAYTDFSVLLRGHTDSTGSSEVNSALSLKRAQNLKNSIVSKGIDMNRISVLGLGPNEPVEANETPEGRSRNRRVDISIVK